MSLGSVLELKVASNRAQAEKLAQTTSTLADLLIQSPGALVAGVTDGRELCFGQWATCTDYKPTLLAENASLPVGAASSYSIRQVQRGKVEAHLLNRESTRQAVSNAEFRLFRLRVTVRWSGASAVVYRDIVAPVVP